MAGNKDKWHFAASVIDRFFLVLSGVRICLSVITFYFMIPRYEGQKVITQRITRTIVQSCSILITCSSPEVWLGIVMQTSNVISKSCSFFDEMLTWLSGQCVGLRIGWSRSCHQLDLFLGRPVFRSSVELVSRLILKLIRSVNITDRNTHLLIKPTFRWSLEGT